MNTIEPRYSAGSIVCVFVYSSGIEVKASGQGSGQGSDFPTSLCSVRQQAPLSLATVRRSISYILSKQLIKEKVGEILDLQIIQEIILSFSRRLMEVAGGCEFLFNQG